MTAICQKLLLRAALALERRRAPPPPFTELPFAAWQDCLRHSQLLAQTESRQWRAAREECRRQLYGRLCELRYQLDAAVSELNDRSEIRQATAREIYEDLVALEAECPALRIDLKERELGVTTEPITLDEVPLGAFEIVVTWSKSGGVLDYRVVALYPNPSSVNEGVTHPHVCDEDLCEGEGAAAIRRCLASGRLWDFFAVVNRTLATYNSGSAFVTLDRWEGLSCSRCGHYPERNYMSTCERCDCDLCDECSDSCGTCGNCCCDDCSAPCRGCHDNFCGACLRRCHTCPNHFCEECLNDGNCNRCRKAADNQQPGVEQAGDQQVADEGSDRAAPNSDAIRPETHASGLGQAHVPA